LPTSADKENVFKFIFDITPGKVHRPFPGDNEHVLTRNDLMAVAAETFSEQPLDSITTDCVPDFRANGYAEPGFSSVVGSGDDHKMGGIGLFPPTRQV
jgi:hypothetical protein